MRAAWFVMVVNRIDELLGITKPRRVASNADIQRIHLLLRSSIRAVSPGQLKPLVVSHLTMLTAFAAKLLMAEHIMWPAKNVERLEPVGTAEDLLYDP